MPVVRNLIRRLRSLPEHAWRTQRLSNEAQAVRHAVENARSPERLLFHELPEAVALPPFAETGVMADHVETFFDRLNAVLQELDNATPQLLSQARDELLDAFGLRVGEEGWRTFIVLSGELAPQVTQASLAPLLRRVASATDEHRANDWLAWTGRRCSGNVL